MAQRRKLTQTKRGCGEAVSDEKPFSAFSQSHNKANLILSDLNLSILGSETKYFQEKNC